MFCARDGRAASASNKRKIGTLVIGNVLLLVPPVRHGDARLREIPNYREQKIPFDCGVRVLRNKATTYIPIEAVILIQKVVYTRFQQ